MQSVAEIKEKLIEFGLTEYEVNEIKGKQNLIKKLEELSVDRETSEMFEEAEETKEENKEIIEKEEKPDIPKMSDPEWSDYVLSHLRDDEKIKGHPKADSLRRLTELLIGSVTDVDTQVVQCPSMENAGRATVVVSVTVECGYITYRASGAADVYPGNTEQLFAKFPVATAETRAEGRAYRKILRLQNVVAAEELVDESQIFDPSDRIEAAQIMMINQMCSKAKLDIDVEKLLARYDISIENLDKISKSKAQEICKTISSYQDTGVPEDLIGYKSDWRS